MALERYVMPNYIVINGHKYSGFSNFFSTDTWSFVDEPQRDNSGVINNLNEYERFPTFRVWITFINMNPQQFTQLLSDTTTNPEFPVEAYSLRDNKMKRANMYLQKDEEQKLMTAATQMYERVWMGDNPYSKIDAFYDNAVEIKAIRSFTVMLTSTNTYQG